MHRLLKNLQNQQARTTACRMPHTPSVALPATFGSENDSAGIAARSRRVKAQDRARRPLLQRPFARSSYRFDHGR